MRQARRGQLRLLYLLMAVSLLLPLALFAFATSLSYRNVAVITDERIDRLLTVLHEHALKIFQSTELLFRATDEILGDANDDQLHQNETTYHTKLKHLEATLTQVQSLWIFDRLGRPLVSSTIFPVPPAIDNSERDYFSAQMKQPVGSFVGEIVTPRVGVDPIFTVSRRRRSEGNLFTGVLAVAINPREIQKFYGDLSQPTGSQFALVRDDGVILARFPGLLDRSIKLGDETGFRRTIAKHPDGAMYTSASGVDGVERRFGVRKLKGYQVYLIAGIETSAMTQEWRSTMTSHLLFGIPATLGVFGSLGVVLQRTKRLHAEAERRETAEQALRQSQKMEAVGQLTGGVAHDFNNLLTIIMGNLEIAQRQALAEGANVPARLQRALEQASHGAQRAATLTQRLLAFSRLQPLAPQAVDVDRLIRHLGELLRRMLGETLELEIVGTAGVWHCEADPAQLEAALLNLAVNAKDAMPSGGKLTIESSNAFLDENYCSLLGDVAPGQYVQIAVTDSGAGMTPETMDRAFEPFFTTKQVGKGTGLGLSQVHGFVKQSGGHVKIYSELGQGTTVKIYLPRCSSVSQSEPSTVKREETSAKPGEAILVVEDDDDVRAHVLETLEGAGYRVVVAARGDQALGLLAEEGPIDLLLTDVVLPGMTGRQIAEEAARLRPGLKVLYMTGYSRNAIVHQGRLDHGVELLQKPFSQAELCKRLRSVLDTSA